MSGYCPKHGWQMDAQLICPVQGKRASDGGRAVCGRKLEKVSAWCPMHGKRDKEPGTQCKFPEGGNGGWCLRTLELVPAFAEPGKESGGGGVNDWTTSLERPSTWHVGSPEESQQSAGAILRQAADTIEQRGNERDQEGGERSMGRAVRAFWALYGEAILGRGYMTETEGWEFMSLLKKSRSAGGAYNPDDYLDDISYCALAAESASNE